MRDFHKYDVWKIAHELVLVVYTEIAPGFPGSEMFGLTSQMKSAAYAIPLNIVEGCGRSTERDFAHFLDIALGSAHELEYCFLMARDLSIISLELYVMISERVNEVKAKLIRLIKHIREDGGTRNA